jgi:anti-sigma B factor antagonist
MGGSRAISLVRTSDGAACVVNLAGDHDLSTVPELHMALSDAADADVIVDLSQATFIDSAVLGELIASHRDATSAGRRWSLVVGAGSGAAVRRILELTGLGAVMAVYTTRDEALGVPVSHDGPRP